MPYLLASWAQQLQQGGGGSGVSKGKTIRTIPHDNANKGATQDNNKNPESDKSKSDKIEKSQLNSMINIIRTQVDDIFRNPPCASTEDESFYRYTLSVEMVIFSGKFSNIYLAHHQDHPEFALVGRVYEPTSKIEPSKSIYMKILRHLGKRHCSIINTWDIFFDSNGRVVIFQEFAIHGNMYEYIKQSNTAIPEVQVNEWVKNVYSGMSFLGDAGVCHRAISPKHVLLTPSAEDADKTVAKLGSFRDSVVYYDPKDNCVRMQPCRPLEKRSHPISIFQAPEVFGDASKEEFDPISADIWSYGATFFFATTRMLPIRYKSNPDDISNTIQKNIETPKMLSAGAKNWFNGLLRGDASCRTTFDKIPTDPWYKSPGGTSNPPPNAKKAEKKV